MAGSAGVWKPRGLRAAQQPGRWREAALVLLFLCRFARAECRGGADHSHVAARVVANEFHSYQVRRPSIGFWPNMAGSAGVWKPGACVQRYGPIDGGRVGFCFVLVALYFAHIEAKLTTAMPKHELWRTSFAQMK